MPVPPPAPAPQEGDALVAAVRGEMAVMAREHAARVEALEARVAWYAQNQALLGASDDLVAQQVGGGGSGQGGGLRQTR
jgi:hypothetical protein